MGVARALALGPRSSTPSSARIGSVPTSASPPAASSAWTRRCGTVAAVRSAGGGPSPPRRARSVGRPAGSATSATSSNAARNAVRQLRALDVEDRPAGLRHQRVAQRQRRVADVGAAHVEQPGDGVRVADEQRFAVPELGAHGGELGGAVGAGEPVGVERHRAPRGGRAVRPDGVDRVAVDRDEFRTARLDGAGQALDLRGCVQPGVEADALPLRQAFPEPGLSGGRSSQGLGREGARCRSAGAPARL